MDRSWVDARVALLDNQVTLTLACITVPVVANKRGPVGGPDLLVELDRRGELPLHEQIERSLRAQIRSGRLPADARLPSTRGLAEELGISRGVVSEAYGQLSAEGYLTTSQGAPVRIAKAVRPARVPTLEQIEAVEGAAVRGRWRPGCVGRSMWERSARSDDPLHGCSPWRAQARR